MGQLNSLVPPNLEHNAGRGDIEKVRTKAYITSAVPLNGEQVQRIREILSDKTDKHVEISFRTDPSLIGGLWIQMDGRFIDMSVKRQIHDMRDSIKRSIADGF